jgi:DNA-binding CsgD family transcriptional regulator
MNKYGLSKRELQIIKLLMEGRSNKQIAKELGISEGTVEYHLTSIYTKLDVGSRAEAILFLTQLGFSPNIPERAVLGESTGKKTLKQGETPDEFVSENVYDGGEQIPQMKGNEMIGKKIRFSRNRTILVILGIILALIAAIALYLYLSMPKTWKGYERECEYPDGSTVGQTIARSKASGELVYGQFGATNVEPWPAMAGDVVYKNINTPKIEQLYLKLRYSKNSPPSVPILVYLDDEKTPRASIYFENQKDWNRFAWTDSIFLGSVESGVHTITFSTTGQQYGVADLDKFVLLAGAP